MKYIKLFENKGKKIPSDTPTKTIIKPKTGRGSGGSSNHPNPGRRGITKVEKEGFNKLNYRDTPKDHLNDEDRRRLKHRIIGMINDNFEQVSKDDIFKILDILNTYDSTPVH